MKHHRQTYCLARASLCSVVFVGSLGCIASPLVAQSVAPVSQIRSVFADSFVVLGPNSDQDLQEIVASGFAPFEPVLNTSASLANGTATFAVDQNSTIAAHGIIASGSALSNSTIVLNAGFCYSVGQTSMQVVFDLDQPTTFRAIASLEAGPNSQTKLVLTGSGGAVISANLTGTTDEVRTSGLLAAGRYTLVASSFASTSLSSIATQSDAAEFTLFFSTSPSPYDLDLDGQVGASDLATLLGSWGPCENCPSDVDASGSVDAADLAALLGAWG
jgi:hypothetical protein